MMEIEKLLEQKPTPDMAAIQTHVADVAIEGAMAAKGAQLGLNPQEDV